MQIKIFDFNPFHVNTYLLYGDDNEAVVIDPAMMNEEERNVFKGFITGHNLNLKRVLLTHGHIDHVAGTGWIQREYGILPEVHPADKFLIDDAELHAQAFGLEIDPPATPGKNLNAGDEICTGSITLQCRQVPGHSPGSLVFIHKKSKSVFSGDTLFLGSIGRTDLPGGSYDKLIQAIKDQLISLPHDYTLYPGHGPKSSIGAEALSNPFVK
ncbi:MAG: MBL fold metallo-hydrolase [Bacteroidota bacterium]